MRTSPLALATGASLVAAVALAVVATHRASPTEVSPVVPRGSWNAVWVACVVAAFVLYAGGVLVARAGRMGVRAAIALAVVVQLVPLGAPLLLSKDAYLYWAEARVLVTHGANPYSATPADYPDDPATRWVSESWRAEPAPYGPGWELAAAVPAAAAGGSHARAQILYRVVAALAVVGVAAVVARRTRSAWATALVGWSPLVAFHFAGGGHSDALMMLALVGALALPATARGGALWTVAGSFKPVAPVLLPLELARTRLRASRRWWAGLLGAAIVVAAVATGLFGLEWVRASTVGVHQSSAFGGVHWLTEAGLGHRAAVVAAAAAFVVVYAALLVHAWRTGRARMSLALSALCLSSSLLRPWYALWPLALAALEEDAVAAVVAIALSAYLLFGDAVAF